MGFKDAFVGLLNSAMSKEVPMEDEDFDEGYDVDFGDDAEVNFDGDDTELVYTSIRSGRRSSFKTYSDVEKSDTEYDFDDSDSVSSSRLDELYSDASSVCEEDATTFVSSRESSSYIRSERYSRMSNYDTAAETTNERKGDRKVVSMNNNSNLKVFLANPTEYADCQDICSRVRSQMTVVVNLEKVKSAEERRRIFDFISGCSYALDCNFERISDSIYIVAPCHVDIFEEISENNQESSRRGVTSFSAILN
ncbi:MAG: cell division protein SepF [Ruminococcaceae bacterium]|nr:cell division protein SepF [Oscillospiraceae bacterium]